MSTTQEQTTEKVGGHLKDLYTRDQFIEQAGALATVTADDFELGDKVKFDCDEERGIFLKYGKGKEARLNHEAMRHICREISMSQPYFENTPIKLLIPHFNHYYRNEFAGRRVRLMKQDGVGTGVSLNPRDQFVGLQIVVDCLIEAIGANNIVGFHKPRFDWDATNINIVLNETFEVVDKDPLNVGIRVVHSLSDAKPDYCYAYTFRQWCANGAITIDKLRRWQRRGGGEDSFRKWVDSVVVESRHAIGDEKRRLKVLAETPTELHASNVLDHLLTGQWIPSELREEVRTRAIDTNTENLYGVWNVITAAATHSPLLAEHPRAIPKLELVAAGLAEHSHLCPTCHRPDKK